MWKEDGNHFVTFVFTLLFCFLPDSFAWFKVMSKGQEEQNTKTEGSEEWKEEKKETTEKKGHMQLWFVMGRQMGKGSV